MEMMCEITIFQHFESLFTSKIFLILEINCLLWKIEIFWLFIYVNNLKTCQQKGKCLLEIIFISINLNFIYNFHSSEEQLKACDVNEKKKIVDKYFHQ
jgi:uncharacterized membrane protein YkgB